MKYFFYFAAVLSACAAIYHAIGICHPTDHSPAWRHFVFCCISVAGVWAMIKRPYWLVYLLVILTLQQWYSHGTYLVTRYNNEHSIHWLSVMVIIIMPVITYAVWKDRQGKIQN
jgi:hypothetical protein